MVVVLSPAEHVVCRGRVASWSCVVVALLRGHGRVVLSCHLPSSSPSIVVIRSRVGPEVGVLELGEVVRGEEPVDEAWWVMLHCCTAHSIHLPDIPCP